jgi:hypothetical protein
MSETLQYLGLLLLLGTVGPFDLHALGMARAIPTSALYGLIPLGTFYLSSPFAGVKPMPAGANASFRAKLIAGTYLGTGVAVLSAAGF